MVSQKRITEDWKTDSGRLVEDSESDESSFAKVFFNIEPEGHYKVKDDRWAKSNKTAVNKVHPNPRFIKSPFFCQVAADSKTVSLYDRLDVFDDWHVSTNINFFD